MNLQFTDLFEPEVNLDSIKRRYASFSGPNFHFNIDTKKEVEFLLGNET
jgi:hypothetical protein